MNEQAVDKSVDESSLNIVHIIIKRFELLFPTEFRKTGIVKCGHCRGTGIKDFSRLEFCDYCGGIGYTGFDDKTRTYVCRRCNGSGCSFCNYSGLVDWVTYLLKKDLDKYAQGPYI